MDTVTLLFIAGAVLLILVTLWNILTSPKKDDTKKELALSVLFKYLEDQCHFTSAQDASYTQGVFKNRSITVFANPLSAVVQVNNPTRLQLLIEKGFSATVPGLVDVPMESAQKHDIRISSNLPMQAAELFDEVLLSRLAEEDTYSLQLDANQCVLRCPYVGKPKDFLHLLQTSLLFVDALDTYTYNQ